MRVLIVDDDRQVCSFIKRLLSQEGYAVDTAYDGEEGEYLAINFPYDLIILDVLLPKKDGIEICRSLRLKKLDTPILMLTTKDGVENGVRGLDTGADDYLPKPFAFRELLAKARALLRRAAPSRSPHLQVGKLVMDTVTREVQQGQRRIQLIGKEYAILEYLMRNPNRIITKTMLEEHVWGLEFDSISNVIDVYIRRLRRKINERERPSLIETVRGSGYRLRAE